MWPPTSSKWLSGFARALDGILHSIKVATTEHECERHLKLWYLIPRWLLQRKLTKSSTAHKTMSWLLNGNFQQLDHQARQLGHELTVQHASRVPSALPPPQVNAPADDDDDEQAEQDGGDSADPLPPEHGKTARARRAAQLIRAGQLSRAYHALVDKSKLAPSNDDTLRQLRDKHPASDWSVAAPSTAEGINGIRFDTTDIIEAVKQMPGASAGGGNRWRAEHIKVYLSAKGNPDLLCDLLQRLADGNIPAAAKPYVYGAVLTPFRKGESGVRPIAIGDVLCRIAGRTMANLMRATFNRHFEARGQLGVAVSGGAEIAAHAARLLSQAKPEWAMFQADLSNAFNTVSRKCIYEKIAASSSPFAPLLLYFLANYGAPTKLAVRREHGGIDWIDSMEGVRQGDPLGPAFFAIGLDDVVQTLREEGTGGADANRMVLAYMDDILLGAPCNQVEALIARLEALLAEKQTKLTLNHSKCVIWSPGGHQSSTNSGDGNAAQWQRPAPEAGLELLGAPIGPRAFEERFWHDKVQTTAEVIGRLGELADTQQEMLLLRYCAVPQPTYMLRTTPPDATRAAARQHDQLIERGLRRCLRLTSTELLTKEQRRIARLPLREGGLGLTAVEPLAKVAYVASVSDTIVKVGNFVPALTGAIASLHTDQTGRIAAQLRDSIAALPPVPGEHTAAANIPRTLEQLGKVDGKLQKRVTPYLAAAAKKAIFRRASMGTKVRLTSQSHTGARSLWRIIPSERALTLTDAEMGFALRYWLGLSNLIEADRGRTCGCGATLDDEHVMICRRAGRVTDRHNNLVQTITEMVRAAGCTARIEPRGHAGYGQGGPDVEITDFLGRGQSVFLDATVVHPAAPSRLRTARSNEDPEPLLTARMAESAKSRANDHLASLNQRTFIPLGYETSGAMGPGAEKVLRRAQQIEMERERPAQRYGLTWSVASFADYYRQRMTTAIWRGNYLIGSDAVLFSNPCPPTLAGSTTMSAPSAPATSAVADRPSNTTRTGGPIQTCLGPRMGAHPDNTPTRAPLRPPVFSRHTGVRAPRGSIFNRISLPLTRTPRGRLVTGRL
jgi:hypothetical protein